MYKTIVSALALSLFAATAFAAAPVFEEIDADKDGAVSLSEAAAAGIGTELFAQLDVDQNGALSTDEYKALSAEE